MRVSGRVLVACALALTAAISVPTADARPRGGGHGGGRGPVRNLQRQPEPGGRGPAGKRPEHPGQRPGPQHRRGAAAGPARRRAAERVRLRAGLRGGGPVPRATTSSARSRARARSATRTRSPPRRTRASRAASTWTAAAPSAVATTRTGSGSSRDSTGWSCCPATRSTATGSVPSSTSAGPTCPARCSRTTRPPRRPRDWYSPEVLRSLRLSSKSHWDLPVRIGRRTVHVLASHPTPPTFDGPEDRNGTRNHDEIRFWAEYVGASGRTAGSTTTRGVGEACGRRSAS